MTEEEKKYGYNRSDSVSQAHQALTTHQSQKPAEYTSQWQSQLKDMMGQIQNRPNFQYDVNADALWNQYANQYLNQGKQAMMDTMGQAAAMTGGYGNSYAQTAGQQTYQGYLQGLNDRLPQFQQMAMDRYNMEGDRLLTQYGMLADQENQEYGRWQDAVNRYYSDLDRLQGQYDTERAFDYGQHRDTVADQQWQTQWDENIRRYNFEHGLGEYAPAGGGSSGGGPGGANIQDAAIAQQFVNNMLNGATSSRFDPEGIISGTKALTEAQKTEAMKYLKNEIAAGRMK